MARSMRISKSRYENLTRGPSFCKQALTLKPGLWGHFERNGDVSTVTVVRRGQPLTIIDLPVTPA